MSENHQHHPGCACCNYRIFGHAIQSGLLGIGKDMFDSSQFILEAEKFIADYLKNGFERPKQQRRIFYGGTIRTMENGDADKTVEAIAIRDGEIVVTGSLADCEAGLPNAEKQDLEDGCLLPGLIEPHVHLAPTASFNSWVPLAPFQQGWESGGNSNDQYLIGAEYTKDWVKEQLLNSAKKLPEHRKWLLAFGMDPSQFYPITENGAPTPWQDLGAKELDEISAGAGRESDDICIFVMNASGHIAYANSNALKAAKNPPNEDGILLEGAQIEPVLKVALEQYFKECPQGIADLFKNLKKIFEVALSRGVTLLWDAALGSVLKTAELEVLRLLADSGIAGLRLGGALLFNDTSQWHDITPTTPQKYHTDWFNIGCAKIVSDGSNQGLTGYQNNKYAFPDANINDTYPNGVWNLPGTFNSLVEYLQDQGWPMMIHANGTHAIENTISAYKLVLNNKEKAGLEKRHRMEHASLLTADNLKDMQHLGISPSFLIGHVGYWGVHFQK